MSRLETPEPRTGTVTSLAAQVRDSGRVSVYIDGSFAFGLPLDAVAELGIAKGVVIDADLLQKALRLDSVYRAKQRAMGLLAHRPRAANEIRDRLRRAGFDSDVIEQVTGHLLKLGYLDDPAFALAYARSRAGARGYGSRRIMAELRRKGIDEQEARQAIEILDAERDPLEDALAVGRKALRRLEGESDPRRRRNRLYGYLARRGYDSDVIRNAMDTLEREQP